MRVIPVIDLLAGQVVRGIAGRRSEYRPVVSQFVVGSRPADIARALFEQFGFSVCYLADLDAIGGGQAAWDVYQAVADAGLRPMVDLGLRDLPTAQRMSQLISAGTVEAAVVGLESLPDVEHLRQFVELLGAARVIFSLDLKDGRPMTAIADWNHASPETIAAEVIAIGIERLLILDLARVGMGGGIGTEALGTSLRRQHPHVELIGGGGIRSPEDLQQLSAAGYDAALVASALHDGRLERDSIR
ncbi:MAG TPA: HisA/HisF-related TIM barrel protein [Pirellulales bacterium]|nr:HisA/HisF-related TIM barrel protein [Pirellulales bacterium]